MELQSPLKPLKDLPSLFSTLSLEQKLFSLFLISIIAQACSSTAAQVIKEEEPPKTKDICTTSIPTPDCFPEFRDEMCNEFGCFLKKQDGATIVCLRPSEDELENGLHADESLYCDDDKWMQLPRNGERVMPLSYFKSLGRTTTDFIKYLAVLTDSLQDMGKILREMVDYQLDKNDRLYKAETTLENGIGDCDNRALVCKRIYEYKGEMEGHDYNPRVLAFSKHAVCVIEEKDGTVVSIDTDDYWEIGTKGTIDVNKASVHFKEHPLSENEVKIRDLIENGYDTMVDYTADPVSLEKDFNTLTVKIYTNSEDINFDPDKHLPSDYKQYDITSVHIGKDSKSEDMVYYYRRGKFVQITMPESVGMIVHKWPDTDINRQIDYEAGNPKYDEEGIATEYFNEEGIFIQRKYVDGVYELIENGVVIQKTYPDGEIDTEGFSTDGTWVEIRLYRNGTTDHFREDGTLKQRDEIIDGEEYFFLYDKNGEEVVECEGIDGIRMKGYSCMAE
ncbi:hypothetical protein ACFL21_04150 [Patescibacteria group bacterium]